MRKIIWAIFDLLAVAAVCWFVYQRFAGVPMDTVDWMLIAYLAGTIATFLSLYWQGKVTL